MVWGTGIKDCDFTEDKVELEIHSDKKIKELKDPLGEKESIHYGRV